MTLTCVEIELLERYASGGVGAEERERVERHTADCSSCRLTLAALGLAFAPGSREEEALIGWMASTRPVAALLDDLQLAKGGATVRSLPVRRTRSAIRWVAGGLAAAAAVLVAVLLPMKSGFEPPQVELHWRAAEGRPAADLGYAPFAPVRGGGEAGDTAWDGLEGAAVSGRASDPAAADGYLTALYLWRGAEGDRARARAVLEARAPTAANDNDRGVLLLAGGQPAEALAAFDEALSKEPELTPARFNRAVALEALGRKPQAVEAWKAYLAGAGDEEAGWVDEARRRMAHLEGAD